MRAADLTLALRNLARRPGVAATAILLLALGTGANAAVLSVVRGVLLRPLSFPDPDRLVAVWPGEFVSNEDLEYWRTHTHGFEHLAGHAPGWMMALSAGGGEPLKVTGARTITFVVLPGIIVIVTVLACAIPARHAASVDPVETMKGD